MALQERRLPLFPLNVVLFPGGTLPLQVFEERYKQMMSDCLDDDSKLGVVLIRSGPEVGAPAVPRSVGTVARILQVNRVEEGRMFVSVVGLQRFKIKEITQNLPYMAAQVELIEDDKDTTVHPDEIEAIRRAAVQHVRLVLGLGGGWVREPKIPSDPLVLSYFIPGILQVELTEKQTLLEEASTPKRLDAELSMLRSTTDELHQSVTKQFRHRFGRQ